MKRSQGIIWGLGGAVQMVRCREWGSVSGKETGAGSARGSRGKPLLEGGGAVEKDLFQYHTSGVGEPSPKLIDTNGGSGFEGAVV